MHFFVSSHNSVVFLCAQKYLEWNENLMFKNANRNAHVIFFVLCLEIPYARLHKSRLLTKICVFDPLIVT